jgi:hypothetical protein
MALTRKQIRCVRTYLDHPEIIRAVGEPALGPGAVKRIESI